MMHEAATSKNNALQLMLLAATIVAACMLLAGCASAPPLTQSGFLSDYSKLESVNNSRMRYESSKAAAYTGFIIDPVQIRIAADKFSDSERAEAARHFKERLAQEIQESGLAVVSQPGVGVARIRVAVTDVAKSTWWQKLHPISRVAGAGTGGAAMEGEVIDSVTGEQIGAVIQAGSGNQFDLTAFSTLSDVKSAIDSWASQFSRRLAELHDTE